jgi:uncharacterized FlaG/YvyC family protein
MRTDSAPPLSVSLLQTWPARVEPTAAVEPPRENAGAESEDQRQRRDDGAAEKRAPVHTLLAGHLKIELDEAAGRFVQTLTDPNTQEVLRRFPHESQLAFARAIGAYTQALTRR